MFASKEHATVAERVQLQSVGFDPVTNDAAVQRLFDLVHQGRRGWVVTVNVAILMMMRTDPVLRSFTERASMVLADGQPLVWLSHGLRTPLPTRVAGVDLIEDVCGRAAREGVPVHLLGASAATVQEAALALAGRHPGLVVTVSDGYFGPEEARGRAQEVAATGARILFVGMGVPRQERFLLDHWDELGVTVAVPVGGSFEVIAGRKSRAPEWMQRGGLEWVHRMVQEPRRLGPRYLRTNSAFLVSATADLLVARR